MYLIVGLGNPGKKYANHRHNIGFQIIDLLAERHSLSFDKKEKNARVAKGMIGTHKVMLAKPQTYMNDSGRAVRALVNFYKIPLTKLIIVVDDLDLSFGKMRLRPKGGSGGQNGMKSIIRELGSQEFARMRVGIGRPPGRMDPGAYVLQNFSKQQETEMAILRQEAADALELWLAEGINRAMNRYN
ncbi:MAG: aminoacyl-tRNA hydrolase [Ardenticatenaceae bacterium]